MSQHILLLQFHEIYEWVDSMDAAECNLRSVFGFLIVIYAPLEKVSIEVVWTCTLKVNIQQGLNQDKITKLSITG